jgi:hypothetical protein
MSIKFDLSLEDIVKRMAKNYGSMLKEFRPFNKGGELNERNLTTQLLIEIKSSFPDAIISQEFHISMCRPNGDSAFVDAVVIINDCLLFIEAKRNSAIMSNFNEIDLDINKLQSPALKTQFEAVCQDRQQSLPKRVYGVILADSWKKSLTNKWVEEYSNELCVNLFKKHYEIACFEDYSEKYDLLYGVFELKW